MKRAKALHRDWLAALIHHSGVTTDDEPLSDVLDRYAEASGATARAVEAETERRTAAAARAEETARHRALKTEVHGAVDRLLAKAPIPPLNAPTADQVAWTETVSTLIVDARLEAEALALMRKALTGRLTRAGHPADRAARVAAHLTTDPLAKEAA